MQDQKQLFYIFKYNNKKDKLKYELWHSSRYTCSQVKIKEIKFILIIINNLRISNRLGWVNSKNPE